MANLTPTCPSCKCLSDVILKARDGKHVCINCANAQLAIASASAKVTTERAELLQKLAIEPGPLPPVEHKLPIDPEPESPWSKVAESVYVAPTVVAGPPPEVKTEKPAKKSDKKKSR